MGTKVGNQMGVVMTWLYVGMGGFFGSLIRFISNNLFATYSLPSFYSTAVVNFTGCFLVGFAMNASFFMDKKDLLLFFSTGFLGALTTFSTFSFESLQLLKQGQITAATLNVVGSVLLGIIFVLLGEVLGKFF
jgi:CrcB protein